MRVLFDMHWGQDLQSFQHKSCLESQLLMNALVLFKEFTCWVFDYLIYIPSGCLTQPSKITILQLGKPSISMGHGFHGYVSHNQRVHKNSLSSPIPSHYMSCLRQGQIITTIQCHISSLSTLVKCHISDPYQLQKYGLVHFTTPGQTRMDGEFKCHAMGGMFSSNSWESPNEAHSDEKQDMIILFYQQLKLG